MVIMLKKEIEDNDLQELLDEDDAETQQQFHVINYMWHEKPLL